MRLARPALFGNDLDDAVARLAPIKRRSSGTLHNLNALDVARTQVIQTRGVVRHAYPVDVEERGRSHLHAGDPAQRHRGTPADVAGLLQDGRAGDAPLQQLIDRRDGGDFYEFRGLDDADRVADLAALGHACRPRHNDLVQRECLLAEIELQQRRLAGQHLDLLAGSGVTDVFHRYRVGTHRNAIQQESAASSRQNTPLQFRNGHLRPLEGIPAALLTDETRNAALLGLKLTHPRQHHEPSRQEGEQPLGQPPPTLRSGGLHRPFVQTSQPHLALPDTEKSRVRHSAHDVPSIRNANSQAAHDCIWICIPIWGPGRILARAWDDGTCREEKPHTCADESGSETDEPPARVYQARAAASLISAAASRSSRYPPATSSRHTRSTSSTYSSCVR